MSGGLRAGTVLGVLLALLLLRLATLGVAPLFDKTEGRYGEIGRAMAASGDWITPTLHGGEPFWGKPPLHARPQAGPASSPVHRRPGCAIREPQIRIGIAA